MGSIMPQNEKRPWHESRPNTSRIAPPFPAALIFLLSASALSLEITLSRLISISLWPHLAFMVISLALLGYGASGTFASFFLARGRSKALFSPGWAALGFSLSVVFTLTMIRLFPVDLGRLLYDPRSYLYLVLEYLLLALPFFFAGLLLSVTYREHHRKAGRIYFWDLTGAGLGVFLPVLIFPAAGDRWALFIPVFVTAGAAALYFMHRRRECGVAVGVLFFHILLFVFIPELWSIPISPYKSLPASLRYQDSKTLGTFWSFSGRADLLETPAARTAPGLSLSFEGLLPDQLGMTLDADDLRPVISTPRKPEDLRFTDFLPTALPYHLGEIRKVLVINPRGNIELLSPIYHGAEEVLGLDSQKITLDILRLATKDLPLPGKAGKITLVDRDPRNFLSTDPGTFDLINLEYLGAMGASSTGIFGLSENYHLTLEALHQYLDHLTPDGFLMISFYLLPPPRFEFRAWTSLIEAIRSHSVSHPAESLAMIRSWGTITLLAKKGAFSQKDLSRTLAFCRERGFDVDYFANLPENLVNRFNRWPEPTHHLFATASLSGEFQPAADSPLDLSPTTDDRPLFNFFFRLRDFPKTYRLFAGRWLPLLEGGFISWAVLVQAMVLGVLIVVLPLVFSALGRRAQGLTLREGTLFFGTGLAFLLIEVGLIHKFTLFLDHPSQSFAVVLFFLLASIGLGSYLSSRRRDQGRTGLLHARLGMAATAAMAALLPLFSDFYGAHFSTFPLPVRYLLLGGLLCPIGLFMGLPLPGLLRHLGSRAAAPVPLAFGVNAWASVIGAALAVIIAQSWGFRMVVWTGGGCYLAALLVSVGWTTKR